MVGPSADLTTEWEGGSLSELVAILEAAALPVRIEVIAPGTTDSNAGEVHLLAGGLADAFAGSLRRDDAMAALQRLEGARFVVEARLPDPESGSLSTPGPHEGSLKDRPVASLMRYCEEYVLTCRLEVWRGPERAAISYRRGEIISTMVGGADGSERLPEVMGWSDGSYEIVLPPPVLPQAPSRKGGARAVDPMGKAERKRHATLPMTAGSGEAEAAAPARTVTGPAPQVRPAPPAQAPAAKAGSPSPAITTARLTPPVQPTSAVAARTAPPATAGAPAATSAQQPSTRQLAPTQQLAGPPAVPAASSSTTKPAAAPPQQSTTATSTAQAARPANRPASPVAPATHAGPAQPAAPAAKPYARTLTPALGSMAARAPTQPLPPEMTARGTPPVPAVPLIPARSAAPPTPPPISPAKLAAAGVEQRVGKAGATDSSTPPPVPVPPTPAPFQLAQPAPGRPGKPAPASNDLKPASGIIEAKIRHANHLPPATAPIEIADQPGAAPEAQPEPVSQAVIPNRPVTSRRARVVRKGLGDQSVKVYILSGLAIGAGIVVAYWAYWYLPFFHH